MLGWWHSSFPSSTSCPAGIMPFLGATTQLQLWLAADQWHWLETRWTNQESNISMFPRSLFSVCPRTIAINLVSESNWKATPSPTPSPTNGELDVRCCLSAWCHLPKLHLQEYLVTHVFLVFKHHLRGYSKSQNTTKQYWAKVKPCLRTEKCYLETCKGLISSDLPMEIGSLSEGQASLWALLLFWRCAMNSL